jgi:type I restriction enzyme S subunit
MKQGWETKKLGEVCDFQGGSQPPKSQFIYEPKDGYVRFLQIRDFASDKNITYIPESKKNRYCKEDDILLGRYGASVGKVLINKAGAYNVAVMKTIPNEAILFKRYLFFYLNTDDFQTKLLNTASRSAQDGFSKDDIFDFPILIPPLPEQQRIVAILDEAFTAIDKAKANTEQNLKNAKELFESDLQRVFSEKGDGWEEKKLIDVCELKSGTTISTALEKEEGDVIYAKVGDMTLPENKIEMITSTRFVNSAEIKPNQIIPKGAIIFPKRGGAIATNKKRKIIKPTIVDLNTMAIIPSNRIDKDLLFHWFQLIDLNKISNGTSIPQINNYSFDNIKISFPKSLKDQQTIVSKLDALREQTKKLEAVYTQKLQDLEELKKSVLQKAFAGEL